MEKSSSQRKVIFIDRVHLPGLMARNNVNVENVLLLSKSNEIIASGVVKLIHILVFSLVIFNNR